MDAEKGGGRLTPLIVIACIIAFLLLLLLSRIKFAVKYDSDGFAVKAGIWFIWLTVAGGKAKKVKKSDFKIKKFRSRCRKVLKKYNKNRLKELNKKTEKPKEQKKKKSSLIPSSPRELIGMVKSIFGEIIKRFPGYLHIKCKKLIISVGGNDAHDIAVKYGETVQAAQYLITFLGEVSHLKEASSSEISIYPDFACGKWNAQLEIQAGIRIINIIRLGLSVIVGFFRYKKQRSPAKADIPADKTHNTKSVKERIG